MKKTSLLFLFACISQGLFAQGNTETLFNKGLLLSEIGFMLAPGFQSTQIGNVNTAFFQVKGGVVFWDKLTVGGFYGESIRDIRPASFEAMLPPSAHVEAKTGGGLVEYTLWSNRLVHLSFPLAVGILELEGEDFGRNVNDDEIYRYFVEPAASIEVNLHKYLRLYGGVGYRFTENGNNNSTVIPEAGNEICYNIGLKFGMFRIKD